ncbi:ArsR/SmtB family transcription factor, partial [Chloroflexota bacterium]
MIETEVMEFHAEICAGLADPVRLMIIYELGKGTRNVNELVHALDMPQPMISRHLKLLWDRGLVTKERQGSYMLYSLADDRLIHALNELRPI